MWDLVKGVPEFFDSLLDGIIKSIKWGIHEFLRILLSPVVVLANEILAMVPDNVIVDLSFLVGYFAIVNHWVPLDTMVSLYGALILFRLGFIGIRYLIIIIRGG